ncbi:GNAT family N-acetyltransferase [Chitinibacteraceae bacterium HSL-7]
MPLHWHWYTLDTFAPRVLFDYLRLRSDIFVVEQRCIFSDMDVYDEAAEHLVALDESGRVRAGLRLLAPGVKYPDPSLGRIVLDEGLRGSGAGDALVQTGLAHSARRFAEHGNRIGAQARLTRFYVRQGFIVDGELYDEDGIPHVEMQISQAKLARRYLAQP